MVDDGGCFLAPRLNKSKNRFNGAGVFHGLRGFGFLVGIKCGKGEDGGQMTDNGGRGLDGSRMT